MLRERNAVRSDQLLHKRLYGYKGPIPRMSKLRIGMARLLTIINERKVALKNYRKYLEDQYVEKKRQEFLANVEDQKEYEPQVPDIDIELLRAKYRDLKHGIDNVEYIHR